MTTAQRTRGCWSTLTLFAAAVPDVEQPAMLPSSAELATAPPAPRRPSGASYASRRTSFHLRSLPQPPPRSCGPPPTAVGRPRFPLLLHPLQCPAAALSMGVLPPLGKLLLPLGVGARHWGGLFCSCCIRRRRQRSGGSGSLYSFTLYNARRRLSHWECCRR